MDEQTFVLGTLDLIAIAFVLMVSASIGIFFWYTGRGKSNADTYLMAGRSMSPFPVTMSLVVTFFSAILMLGLPAEVYMYGLYRIVTYVGYCIGTICTGYMFLPLYFEGGKSTSVYEYLERRFGKSTRNIASVLFAVQMILYLAVVLYAPALALSAVTGMHTWVAVVSIGAVCTFYSTIGGLKAVLWTDVFQAMVMYIGVIIILVRGVIDAGGITEVLEKAGEHGRLATLNFSLDPTVRYTVWNSLTFGLVFGFSSYGCNQAQVQRMLSVKNLKNAQKSVFISVPLSMIFLLMNFAIGVVLFANYYSCDPLLSPTQSKIERMDQLVPYFIMTKLTQFPGLAGICVAGIFCGSLSTISSAVNSLAAITMVDFVRPYCSCKNFTEGQNALLAKALACMYGSCAVILAFAVASFKGIVEAQNVLFGVAAGPILGLFLLGITTLRANEKGVISGLCSGFFVATWIAIGARVFRVQSVPLSTSIDGCDTFNQTVVENSFNFTSTFISAEMREVPVIYRTSFMWFATIGFVVTITVGYLVSLITGRGKRATDDPSLISPFLRNRYFRTFLPEKENQFEMIHSTSNGICCTEIGTLLDNSKKEDR